MEGPQDEISAVGTMAGLLSDLTVFSDVRVVGAEQIYAGAPSEMSPDTMLVNGAYLPPWQRQNAGVGADASVLLYGMSMDRSLPGTVDAQCLFKLIEFGKISAKTLVYFYQRAFEVASEYFKKTAEKGEAFPGDHEITESVFDSVVDDLEGAIASDSDFKAEGDVYMGALANFTESIENITLHAVLDARIMFLRNSAAGKVAEVSVV